MCHLVLFMPILALPVFWLLPVAPAVLLYLVILGLSGWLYYVMFKVMRRPRVAGAETLIDRCGKVVDIAGGCPHVRIGNEVWKAESRDTLHDRDTVRVIDRDGLTLRVRRLDPNIDPFNAV